MTEFTLSRRQFLRSTTRIGVTLALTTGLCRPVRPVQAQETSLISIPQGTDILSDSDVQNWIAAGLGGLWVAGNFLNFFARNLVFENLPAALKLKYLLAGGEYKSMPAAKAIWETIPAPIRAGGPEALWKFHKGKDWSHIIPRSWGGPTTAENGIWWCSPCNKKLGALPIPPLELYWARHLLTLEAMRFAILQTIRGMVRGGMVGVVVGGLLSCLECGLQYAEGKITWGEMVAKIVNSSIVAGTMAFTITGLIVGVSLAFPFLIPIFAPLLIVLQTVGLVFLGQQVITLAKGWWDVLHAEESLETFAEVLESVKSNLRSVFKDAEENVLNVVWDWIATMADRVGIERAWDSAVEIVQQLGIDRAWVWFAAQTQVVTGKAADLTSALKSWEYLPDLDVNVSSIKESIASVVTSEFQDAISIAEELLRGISDYHKNANLGVAGSLPVI